MTFEKTLDLTVKVAFSNEEAPDIYPSVYLYFSKVIVKSCV